MVNDSKENNIKDNNKSAKEELYNELKKGLDVVNEKSGVPAEIVFDKIEKEFGFNKTSS